MSRRPQQGKVSTAAGIRYVHSVNGKVVAWSGVAGARQGSGSSGRKGGKGGQVQAAPRRAA